MDALGLKAKIIERLKDERDPSKLDTILRLLELPASQWNADDDLVASVVVAEQEYANGKAVPLEMARVMAKRRTGQ